jgi:hypothetical protein
MASNKRLTDEHKYEEEEVKWNTKLRKENEKKRTKHRKLQRKLKRGNNKYD